MTNPNSPAFPLEPQWKYSALAKREYFAAIAMQGILANSALTELQDKEVALAAVSNADHLIATLNRTAY